MKNVKNNCQEVEKNKEKLERIWQNILGTIEFGNQGSTLAHSFIHLPIFFPVTYDCLGKSPEMADG